ncbi:hypothetical protein LTR70_006366 [Exophiala xenobiotica]|uniref:Heterokaryon incompatibility domain-containing protein n=1 Tax=Lithohypha guttulata TaxID=1690604 RepID=A0ABR0KJC6_9EURO|nr:hypothetical protein LTR24_001988 [Lithohypha guttulata]KAK5316198.1 hypothetical protein LTR70_006366 [Exophiala xenobiotica]
MDRWKLGKRHDTGDCSELECKYEKIDEHTYQTVHDHACDGSCDEVNLGASSLGLIVPVISQGNIPLVVVNGEGASMQVQVVSATIENRARKRVLIDRLRGRHNNASEILPYVAISHVWSDGLGNTRSNALPRCQLRRLQDCANSLFPRGDHPVPFWIDTICVPLEQPGRRNAIISMRDVYVRAEKVLVLDSVLSEVSCETYAGDLLMRIRASTWVRRVWTFHECQLAKSLHYQFLERALSLRELQHLQEEQQQATDRKYMQLQTNDANGWSWDPAGYAMNHEYVIRIKNLDPLMSQNCHILEMMEKQRITSITGTADQIDAVKLAHAALHVRWRRTSRRTDETICLAGVMGRRVDDLVALDTNTERMRRLMTTMSGVPSDILFVRLPRIQEDGYRWIPKTFLGERRTLIINPTERAFPTPRGLRCKRPCILFTSMSRLAVHKKLLIGGEERESIFIGLKDHFLPQPYPHPQKSCTWEIYEEPTNAEDGTLHWDDYQCSDIAIVLQETFQRELYKDIPGVLVLLKKRGLAVLHCRYERQIVVRLLPQSPTGPCGITKSELCYPFGKLFYIS